MPVLTLTCPPVNTDSRPQSIVEYFQPDVQKIIKNMEMDIDPTRNTVSSKHIKDPSASVQRGVAVVN